MSPVGLADVSVTAYLANVETIAGTVEQVWDKQTHLQLHPAIEARLRCLIVVIQTAFKLKIKRFSSQLVTVQWNEDALKSLCVYYCLTDKVD